MHFDPVANMQLLVSGLAFGSIYALVALGFVLIYNAVGVVNFAQGEFVMFPSYVAVSFILPAVTVFGTVVHWQLPIVGVYVLVLITYILTSWVRLPYSLLPVQRFLSDVCEPYLRIFRRLLPSLGPLDLSPVVAIIVLFLLRSVVDAIFRRF